MIDFVTRYPVPKIENIHQKVYQEALKHLNMGDSWDTCRAGIVVRLAGMHGRFLAELTHPATAALAIYAASDPGLDYNKIDFHATNATALADMKELAECEAAAEAATAAAKVEQAKTEPELELA